MGKTVKSRALMSVISFVCVAAICIWANSSIPSLYESYKEKSIAQAQASASSTSQQVAKPAQSTPAPAAADTAAPVEEAAPVAEDTSASDTNVFEIEEPVEEEPMEAEEEPVEEEVYEEEEPEEEEEPVQENKSFFEKVLDFIKGIFDTLFSGSFIDKIKEFFSSILGLIGINL